MDERDGCMSITCTRFDKKASIANATPPTGTASAPKEDT